MKTNTLLLIASLAVLTISASAAQNQTENEVVVLPTYTVAVPRYTAVEQQINASLAEVRQQANNPCAVPTECSALKAALNQSSLVALKTGEEKAGRVAKL